MAPASVVGSHCWDTPFHFRYCPSSGVILPSFRPLSPVTVAAPGAPVTSPPIPCQLNPLPSLVSIWPAFPVGSGTSAPCTVQTFTAVQTYRFFPAAASVFTNVSPIVQTAGTNVPVLDGRVFAADEKSIFFPWVRRSICVCPLAAPIVAAATQTYPSAVLVKFMFFD